MKKLFLVALALTAPAAAHAQKFSGGKYGMPEKTPENLADFRMRGSAFCVQRESGGSTDKVLSTGVASKEEEKAVEHLGVAARKCFPANFPKYPTTVYRNALAEALYRVRYLAKPPTRPRPTQQPASFAVVADGTTGSAAQELSWQLAAIARCAVFFAPDEAREFVLGPRFVPEEETRFTALKPALVKCVGQKNADVLQSRTFRGFIGDALLAQAEGR